MTNLPTEPRAVVAALERLHKKISAVEPLLAQRDELVRHGRAMGIVPSALAAASGLSAGRISQLAPAPAVEADGAPVSALAPEEREQGLAEVPRMRPDAPALSGLASTGARTPYSSRVSAWVDLVAQRGVDLGTRSFVLRDGSPAALLAALAALPGTMPARVFVVGPAPQDVSRPHESAAAAVRAWGLLDPGEDWRVSPKGHYLADTSSPAYRWVHVRTGHEVEVMRAAAWFGDGDYSVEDARDAWAAVRDAVAERFPGGTLLSTPGTTGQDLWRRTIPHGRTFPVLSAELRELLAMTAGQGRTELVRPTLERLDELPAFSYLDGRLMYSALTWGMPVGEPQRRLVLADTIPSEAILRGRSRWLVTATVPEGWSRVGLLMAPRPGGGWEYPATPGMSFTTWADGSEAHLALSMGWRLRFHEGMTWDEGKPLDAWKGKLVDAYHALDGHRLAQRGIRSLLLFTIGSFAARGHASTLVVPVGQERELPSNARVSVVGDNLVATVPGARSAWAESMAHPEWSALVWARARVRLLTGRGVGDERTGALHLPAGIDVLGFRTDALYLTGDPGWADDGAVGRFRVKGHLAGPLDVPAGEADLFALRDRAELAVAR